MTFRPGPRSAAGVLALLLLAAPATSADPESAEETDPARRPAPRGAATVGESTAAADAEVAAARARFDAMQELSQAHAEATADATRALQTRMKAARTLEERRAIQAEFQRAQRAREEELKRKLMALRGLGGADRAPAGARTDRPDQAEAPSPPPASE